ncbi:ciliary neurotrophic factor receptor subunit alpha isoform X2 [Cricetulus griseus]|uniref:Ciliary neurotrophic factor receptor subunit alpha n=2 Tax=Cricetulus griseus TaxID=10029 RepID=A0A9J7GMI5_CRIGR|nr:ciliary neurotrophic factor receptor subunit alpha isoform X2 [Cricetulus griseus]
MAASVPWACCAVLAAAAAAVYTQKHSPQEAPHVQYERLGSDVMLPCGTASWEAAVTWRVNGTDLAPDLLNGSQLVLRSLELGHSGLYACFHRDSWHLRHQVLLHVGLPPREPVLSCRSNTYPKGFYCSWHLPTPTYIPNTFNVTVLHGSKIMVCEKDPALKNRCHIRYMHLFSTIKYKVSISVSNALGHNTTAITFDEFTIVKPDPPENVVARPVPSNPRRLEVTWQTPSTWPDPESFPLKFFLRYRPLILDQWQHVELSDGTAHTITDAYAGKEYIIQVAAKDNEIGTWSDWSVAAHATPWTEEPRHLTTEAQAPETTTSTTSSLAPPPTTKICDPGELGSGGGPSIPFLNSVPVILALAAAAATANNLLICWTMNPDTAFGGSLGPDDILALGGSIGHSYREVQATQISTASEVVWPSDTNMAPDFGHSHGLRCCSFDPNATMALGSSTGHSDLVLGPQHGLRMLTRPWASTQPLVATGATSIHPDPDCYRATIPDMALNSSLGPDDSMVLATVGRMKELFK